MLDDKTLCTDKTSPLYATDLAYHIQSLKFQLRDTDYISAKMADKLASCSSSAEVDEVLSSFNAEYAEVLEQRQQWRDEINELEAELASFPLAE